MSKHFEIEAQAQRLMTPAVRSLIKNIKARIPFNWHFGIIFWEDSRSAPPTIWACSKDQQSFVDAADDFVKTSKQARQG